MEQRQCVGLDVSQAPTSICVIDEAGAIVWRGKTISEPDAIVAELDAHTHASRALVWRQARSRIG